MDKCGLEAVTQRFSSHMEDEDLQFVFKRVVPTGYAQVYCLDSHQLLTMSSSEHDYLKIDWKIREDADLE